MLDRLRDQIAQELAAQSVGVLTLATPEGPLAMPVRCQAQRLQVECVLPRWSDLAYHLEQSSRVLLVLLLPSEGEPRWLRYEGIGRPIPAKTGLYQAVQIDPIRIDLIDPRQGWGARETLEC